MTRNDPVTLGAPTDLPSGPIRIGRRTLLSGLTIALPLLPLFGCKRELSCNDTSELPTADVQTRVTYQYVDKSADPQKRCMNCNFFLAAAENACGGCKLVKGPINPNGNCKSWALKGAPVPPGTAGPGGSATGT